MNLVIVDTDILIDCALEVKDAVQNLDALEKDHLLAVSVVTQMELLVGCRNKAELRKVEQFLERFEVLPINDQISQLAVELLKKYHLSHGLLSADALIAATAIEYDLEFITKNQRDYRFIAELNLLAYPV
ncbi:MAG: type II toxin-antitoxin system VapC family toxin [Chloroflexi bacterium]|nr:type II toxin-antitoxin system VapC family toxin [Chloroflexota bacterium]